MSFLFLISNWNVSGFETYKCARAIPISMSFHRPNIFRFTILCFTLNTSNLSSACLKYHGWELTADGAS